MCLKIDSYYYCMLHLLYKKTAFYQLLVYLRINIYTYFTNWINSRLDLNSFKGYMTMKLTLPIIRYIPSPGDLPLNCYGFSHNFWWFWLPMPKFFFLGQIVLLNYVLQNILCKLCVSALCMLLYTVIFMRVGLW